MTLHIYNRPFCKGTLEKIILDQKRTDTEKSLARECLFYRTYLSLIKDVAERKDAKRVLPELLKLLEKGCEEWEVKTKIDFR